eukprot:gb/GECG01012979.1/.p1 GENE.gb/GECG01012979.1/~~gb/GECG01012979.1/.p1  ORF type:complete len:123 (+),score=10.96 gb/GECG01012979.1/:1-369(+)
MSPTASFRTLSPSLGCRSTTSGTGSASAGGGNEHEHPLDTTATKKLQQRNGSMNIFLEHRRNWYSSGCYAGTMVGQEKCSVTSTCKHGSFILCIGGPLAPSGGSLFPNVRILSSSFSSRACH